MNYTYSIIIDTANSKVAISKLASEIEASSISVTLSHINTNEDVLDIVFDATLPAGDVTTLTALVAAHDGEPAANVLEPIPVLPLVFPDDSGLYFRGLGGCSPLSAGLNTVDIDFTEDRLVNKVEVWTDTDQFGTKSDFQVVDKTGAGVALGLYPQAYFDSVGEVVLQPFGTDWQIHPGHVGKAEPGYKAAIYAGLTIRLNVTAPAACNLYYNLYLHKET